MEAGADRKNAAQPSHPLGGGQGNQAALGSLPDPACSCQLALHADLKSGCYDGGK